MLNCRPSFECWAAFPHSCKHGFGQSSHHSLSAKQPRATKVLQCSSNVPKSFGVYQPYGLWVLLRCAFKSTTPQSATRLEQNTAKAEVMGYWLWVMGYGLWAGVCGVPLSVPFASNLSPYRLLPHRLIASSPLISNLIPCLQAVF